MSATSHYDVLGVQPDAGHEEIRHAYVQRALQFHPDRHLDAGAGASETAAFRMREVNAAWAVLGDPRRRAAYDQSLRPRDAAAAVVAEQLDDLASPAPSVPSPGTAGSGGARWVGPILVLAALVVVAVAVALLQPGADNDGIEVQTGSTYEPGMCVAVRPGPVADVVPCSQPSSGRIVEVQPFPKPCANGSLRMVALPRESALLCLETVS